MNCPVHQREELLFIHNILMHHKDGSVETLLLYECKGCNLFYISTKSLQDGFTRKMNNGKMVKNIYIVSDMRKENKRTVNSKLTQTADQFSCFVNSDGINKNILEVNLYYQKGFGKLCPKCKSRLVNLKIAYSSNGKVKHLFSKKCPSCGNVYMHINNYKRKKECFKVVNSGANEYLNPSLEKSIIVPNNKNLELQNNKNKNEVKSTVIKAIKSNPKNTHASSNVFKINNLVLDKNEIRYLMCELRDTSTGKIITVTITSTNISRSIDNETRILSAGSELGQLCLRAVANDIEVINYTNITYSINRFVRYDIAYVEAYRDKTFKKLFMKTDDYPLDPKQIDKKIVYVYLKMNNTCLRSKHSIENVTMKVSNIRDNRKIDVNVFHCITCGKYFINYEQLKEYIDRKQIPAFKYSIAKGSFDSLNEISELMLYGYTVKEGVLRESERQGILAWILDCNLMSKNQIINNIQYKIDYNGKKESNAKAKLRWEDDLAFVAVYRLNTQARIQGKVVWK